ncbi:MAG: sensor histidine kinase [Anaerolineae bacterium]|nr:sensor histidine kinase [Anaerolineae bacterium]
MPQQLFRAYEAVLQSLVDQAQATAAVLMLADSAVETPHILTQVGRLTSTGWVRLLEISPPDVFIQPLASQGTTTALLAVHSAGQRQWAPTQQCLIRAAAQTIENLSRDGNRELDWHQITASRRILPVTEEELCRIVLDIHDGPVQKIYAAVHRLSHLQHLADRLTATADDDGDKQIATYRDNLQQVGWLLETALTEIRTFLGTFHPPEFKERSLLDILEGLIIQHETMTQAIVHFEAGSTIPEVDVPIKIALYRILQQALTNGIRHGGVNEQFVYLWSHQDHIHLEVVDYGKGFTPPSLAGPSATERNEHIGLRGMRDRAQLVGGTFDLVSRPGEGTRIKVRVPCYG